LAQKIHPNQHCAAFVEGSGNILNMYNGFSAKLFLLIRDCRLDQDQIKQDVGHIAYKICRIK
jgi:hypothetical protein